MSDQANIQGEFIVKILETLNKNGFPDKQVALPLEKMYASAAEKGINFNRILDFLLEKEGIGNRKDGERIIFFKEEAVEATEDASSQGFTPPFDMDAMKNMDLGSLMSQASSILKNMTPEQMSQAMEMAKNMSGDQVNQMKNMFQNMSPEQKEELKKQAESFTKPKS